MKKRSNAYWDKRSLQRMVEYHRGADSTVQIVNAAYDKAQKDIEAEVEKIFGKFARDGNLSAEEAQKILNESISNAEWNSIKRKINNVKDPKIKRQMLNRLNAPAYNARITRLEALKENAYLQSKIIADVEITAGKNLYIKTMKDAYHRTMFDVQKGIGLGFEFAAMPVPVIQNILKQPWAGKQFSERIWDNTDVLAKQVNEVITAGFVSGIGTAQMSRELAERMNVGKHAANRIVRTETTYMANMAEMESYEEAEIDEYMFLATLDKKTSKICQMQDLKVYMVKDAMPGVSMPPMHPFCRSSTRGYFGPKTLDNIERRARNPVTGKNELVPADMNYEQWRKSIDEKHGEGKVDTLQKQIQNKATDKKQYQKYKAIYGKDLEAKNFEDFQNLKYNKSEKWDLLKSRKQQVLNSSDYRDSFHGKFGNKEVREWYISHDKDIVNKLDRSKGVEQAVQAHSLRNKYRTEARLMMQDRLAAEELNKTRPNVSFEDLIKHKRNKYGLSETDAYQDIIRSSQTTNTKVNKSLGLE